MQALLPRTAETARTTANENSRPTVNQHKYMDQNQKEVYNEQRSVVMTNKTEGSTVDKDGRNGGGGQGSGHFYAGGGTEPGDVAKMDKNLMCNIHFCDGRRPYPGEAWDEEVQRAYYPGEGDIPLEEYAGAIKATGYDGPWSIEPVSRKHWEEDGRVVAQKLFMGLCAYVD
jgi:sugar phosphate isomerase/epimerase